MRSTHARKRRSLVIATVATGLIAGAIAAGTGTGLFDDTASPAENDSTNQAVLAAAQDPGNTNGGERCTPKDKKTYYKYRQGWVGKPQTLTWTNKTSLPQQYQGTFSETFTATGGISGDLSLASAGKQKKALGALGNSIGYELGLSLNVTDSETRTYNVPAKRVFIAKRGIWKESYAVKRHQTWSNCETRIEHIGNITGVREMYETSEKKLN